MELLVLGGTVFLGRAVVEAARARGHGVTLFTRGETNPSLFPDVAQLRGDRDGGLGALEAGTWGAVVDTSGYVPRVVEESARLLAPRVGHYAFVSSISVYASFAGRVAEDSPVARLEDPSSEDVQEHYGALKAGCEAVVQDVFGERALAVRPGLIVGPHDPTDRFTYWVRRVAEGGELLAPGRPDRPIQFIDVRDLAQWIVSMVERREAGVFNATGPHPRSSMGALLDACRTVSGSDARLTWVDDEFLLERGVGEWDELPLWVVDRQWRGIMDADVSRALAAGLTLRSIERTVEATLAWTRESSGTPQVKPATELPPAGLSRDREAELLTQWASGGGRGELSFEHRPSVA